MIDTILPTLTFTGNATQATSSVSSVTYSSMSLGPDHPTRSIFVCLGLIATTYPSTMTIGGVPATLLIRQTTSYCCDIWVARVPSGTSGNITFNGTNINYSGIGVYASNGLLSLTPFDTFGAVSSNPTNYSIDIPANGICLATLFSAAGSGTPVYGTWSGSDITKDYGANASTGTSPNSTYTGAHYTGTTPITGKTFSCQTTNFSFVQACAVSLR